VALLKGSSQACLVALTGNVIMQNGGTFSATNCGIASNAPGASISLPTYSGAVTAQMVITVGTCTGCAYASLTSGYQEHAPPVSNPYSRLDSKAQPTFSGASCLTIPAQTTTAIAVTGTSRAYCNGTMNVNNTGNVVAFTPGTYIFQNASLNISSVGGFTCAGCTFVFTTGGGTPGTLNITNTSTVTISAPASNSADADYDGVLFYRVASGTAGSSGSPTLNMQGLTNLNLTGGMYFPQAYVKIANLSSSSTATCRALVGGTLDIGQLGNFNFSVAGCAANNTPVPATQVARLTE
jgi:hypothetical protein